MNSLSLIPTTAQICAMCYSAAIINKLSLKSKYKSSFKDFYLFFFFAQVSCIHEVTRGNTVTVPNTQCPPPIPRTERLCNAIDCPPFWQPGDWVRVSKQQILPTTTIL